MTSDEEDYMSDKFVQSAEQSTPALSLLYRNTDKRTLDILKRKKEVEEKLKRKKKSMKVLEQEERDKGLNAVISSENKGFAMLTKMGYKPGQGIGKSQTGISEPIMINVKDGKSGLGKDTQVKEYRARMKKRTEEFNVKDFRSRLASKKTEQLTKSDLTKSQNICQQLDADRGVESPKEGWFWPAVKADEEDSASEGDSDEDKEDDDEEESLTPSDKLEAITNYLRSEYNYCIWCAVKYENEGDLGANCPGSVRHDH